MPYCIYLRKSRADIEAEERGEGETLARHQRALLELAARQHIRVDHIYREVVSGDTIAARPEMQRLLTDLRRGRWTGVLCMEVERLARGDTIDQGVVTRTFKYAGTRIITPAKTYDPDNEMDEEYFEFSLFMSRREYKTIKRRLQAGRRASVREGHYCGSIAPYGYVRKRLPHGEGWTLAIEQTSADVVRMMFDWAAHGPQGIPLGSGAIATRLNAMGLRTRRNCLWSQTGVLGILRNPVYIGYVTWDRHRSTQQLGEDGSVRNVRCKGAAPIMVRGMHEPLIQRAVFDLAQRNIGGRKRPRAHDCMTISNPFAGLMYCAECGHALRRVRSGGMEHYWLLSCPTTGCPTCGISVPRMEQALIDALDNWLAVRDAPADPDKAGRPDRSAGKAALQAQLDQAERQRGRLHDLLEQGVYDARTYLERCRELDRRIASIGEQLQAASRPLPPQTGRICEFHAQICRIRTAYTTTESAALRNAMLKSLLKRIVYHKTRRGSTRSDPARLITIDIYPA